MIKGLAWVVVNPIPGQEEKNAIYLHTLAFKVRAVLEEPGRLAAMRKNALRLARPEAGAEIAHFVTGGLKN